MDVQLNVLLLCDDDDDDDELNFLLLSSEKLNPGVEPVSGDSVRTSCFNFLIFNLRHFRLLLKYDSNKRVSRLVFKCKLIQQQETDNFLFLLSTY